MGDTAYPVDPKIVEELLGVERCSMFLGSGPLRPEFWEIFTLLKASRQLVLDEVKRLTDLRAAGQPATIGLELHEKLLDIRRELYGLASDLRPFLSRHPGMRDGMRLELALVFIMSSARGRESATKWVADPASQGPEVALRIQLMGRMADAYCKALMEARRTSVVSIPDPLPPMATAPPPPPPPPPASAPAPASVPVPVPEPDIVLKPQEPAPPPKPAFAEVTVVRPAPPAEIRVTARLQPQFLEDLEIVQQLRRALEGPRPAPAAWEVHALVALRHEELRGQIGELERLKKSGKPGEFAGAAYAMRERIREARSKHEVLAGNLRVYLEKISGGWQGEAEEVALAILMGSTHGRHRVTQWLEDPESCRNEAISLAKSLLERAREHIDKGGRVAAGP